MDYVQFKAEAPGSENTTVTLTSTPTAGNTLVAGLWRDTATDPSTLPTGFTKVIGPIGTGTRYCWVYAKASASGSEGGLEFQARQAIVYEIPTAELDVSDTDEGNANVFTLTTGTTATDDVFGFTVVIADSDKTFAVNNSFTIDQDSGRRAAASKDITTQAAVSVEWNWSAESAVNYGGILVVYKSSAPAPDEFLTILFESAV